MDLARCGRRTAIKRLKNVSHLRWFDTVAAIGNTNADVFLVSSFRFFATRINTDPTASATVLQRIGNEILQDGRVQ